MIANSNIPQQETFRNEYDNNIRSNTSSKNNDMGGNFWKSPRSIFSAISEIQRFHVIESKTEIPREYFTIEQVIDFFKIGFWGGIIESFLFTLMVACLQVAYPAFKNYFFSTNIGWVEIAIINLITYSPVLILTFLMIFLSKYYQGDFTKRAIYSLINGRCISFIIKSLLVFYCLKWLYKISNTDYWFTVNILKVVHFMCVLPLFPGIEIAQFVDYYYVCIRPSLVNVAEQVVVVMGLTAAVPYLTIFRKSLMNRIEQRQAKEDLKDY